MDRETDPSMGEVVTILRVIRGWNQRQLADAAGVTGAAISRYEEGSRSVPAARLAAAMGFPPHQVERTRSFLRWAHAARDSHSAVGGLDLPASIDVAAGELGLWLEDLAREGLAPAIAPPPHAPRTAWWQQTSPGSSASPGSTTLGTAIVVLRVIRGWTRQQLADTIGSPEGTLVTWERGHAKPRSIATLERLVDAMGFPPATLGRALAFVESARTAREWHLAGGDRALAVQAADVAARAAQSLEDFTRATATWLSSAKRLLASRRAAPELWQRFRSCTEPGQLELARVAAEFHTSGFVELLCEESRNAAADSAARALHLADCAAAVAAAVPGSDGLRSRLEGYAGVHRASALRVGGDLNRSDRAFSRADELWQAGADSDHGLLNAARVLHLKASLRRDQRRLDEALALLDQALEIDRWGETPTLLLGKAKALEELGQHEAALALLPKAESQLDPEREPRNLFVVRSLQVFNLCHLGRHAEAEIALADERTLAIRLGNRLDLLRVDWGQGTVAAGLGWTGEAIIAFRRVRAAFTAQGNAYDAALVTLELAEIYAAMGRTAEVKALARESAPVFQAQGVHREARQALELFRRAADEERVSAELVRGVVTYLYRSRHDARVRFGAAA